MKRWRTVQSSLTPIRSQRRCHAVPACWLLNDVDVAPVAAFVGAPLFEPRVILRCMKLPAPWGRRIARVRRARGVDRQWCFRNRMAGFQLRPVSDRRHRNIHALQIFRGEAVLLGQRDEWFAPHLFQCTSATTASRSRAFASTGLHELRLARLRYPGEEWPSSSCPST
jgi:hypothetical protein